jgi:mannosyltransferase
MTAPSCVDKRSRWLEWWPWATVLAFGCFLRLYQIGQSCFWYDEAQTLLVARLPLGQIALTAYRPPLYHYLLHFWSLWVPSTEFWLRMPSFLFGMLALVGVALVTLQLYNKKIAFIATLLAAISPVFVYYSQELRMYSLMTAAFLAILFLFIRIVLKRSEHRWINWAALWLAEAIAMYSHYFSAPFLVTISLVAITLCLLQRRWRTLRNWLLVQVAVVAAFIPWLLVIFGGRGGISDYTAAELAPVNPIVPTVSDFIKQLGGFYTQGPAIWNQYYDQVLVVIVAVGLALAVLLIVVSALRHLADHSRDYQTSQSLNSFLYEDMVLVLVCVLPLLMAIVLFYFRPGVVSPRHLMMFAGPFVILQARGVAVLWSQLQLVRSRILVITSRVLAIGLLIAAIGLQGYAQLRDMQNPEQLRPNVRALAQVVALYAGPDDLVLMPYQDYAFDYYFHDQARVFHLETRVPDVDLITWALPRLAGAKRAVLLRWVNIYADPRDYLAWFLQANGKLVYKEWVADRLVTAYTLNSQLESPPFTPIGLQAQAVRLGSGFWPNTVQADQPLAVGFSWEAVQAPGEDLRVAVRLVDSSGTTVARDDRFLLAEQTNATSANWLPGTTARNYYLLNLPTGTPPITCTLEVRVYDNNGELPLMDQAGTPVGTSFKLGTVRITPADAFPETFPQDVVMTPVAKELAPGLQLVGYVLDRNQIQPGSGLFVTLYWKALTANPPDYPIKLELLAQGPVVAGSQEGAPANGLYPTSLWRQGELVIDRRLLRADPGAAPGKVDIILTLDGYGSLKLGEVDIDKSARSFTLPVMQQQADSSFGGIARLRGYDFTGTSADHSQPYTLTLYWEALNQQPLATNYVVFTHLLDKDGKVIAQHDGTPADGDSPTSSWVAGQIITDPHALAFLGGSDYTGPASIEVGLYDPLSSKRLTLSNGEDHLVLPIVITVH